MRIGVGTRRVALIGEKVTIKLPFAYFGRAGALLVEDIKKGYKMAYALKHAYRATQNNILRGMEENRQEARLSNTLGNIVVPTLFSALGLINFQATAGAHGIGIYEINRAFQKIIGDAAWYHTFVEQENYGLHKGKLKILDYGEERAEPVLLKHRQEIRKILDGLKRY